MKIKNIHIIIVLILLFALHCALRYGLHKEFSPWITWGVPIAVIAVLVGIQTTQEGGKKKQGGSQLSGSGDDQGAGRSGGKRKK